MIDNLLPNAASLLSAFPEPGSQKNRLLRPHTPLGGASERVTGYQRGLKIFLYFFAVLSLFMAQSSHAFESDWYFSKQNSINPFSTCPSADFTEFLSAFANSTKLQRTFTKIPLKVITVIDATAEPLPELSIKYLKKSQIKFPVIYTRKNLERYGLIMGMRRQVDDAFFIVEESAGEKNLGHYVEYKFVRENGCWKLSEMNNQST